MVCLPSDTLLYWLFSATTHYSGRSRDVCYLAPSKLYVYEQPHTVESQWVCSASSSRLRTCGLSSSSIQFLTAALKSNPQHLTELHLMGNNVEDSDIRMLTELIKNQKYSLQTIEWVVTTYWCHCESFSSLISALFAFYPGYYKAVK